MTRRMLHFVLLLIAARMAAPREVCAQWTKVLDLPGTRGASAFFFNANEGLIGTGEFNPVRPTKFALIFFTTNGGATWNQSKLPRTTIRGEVTDIFFRDSASGWATIRETRYNGWSGVYHSTDRGRSWSLVKPAQYPTGIRETKRGVFYCNHTDPGAAPIENGVLFSSDTARTWRNVGGSLYPLGIDFVDDANGFATGGGGGGQGHLITSDGGKTWTMIDVPYECWSVFGDPTSKNFVVANEIPHLGGTNVLRAPIGGATETAVKSFNDTLTGGIAGWRGCTTTIYVQGRSYKNDGPHGIIRTLNGGINWKDIGGPSNVEDTRFAVTGRGAVVYAFDSSGGVWKTGAGGDTTLSPSALKYVTIQKTQTSISAHRCDSAYATLLFGYRACDSSRVARVTFLDDSLSELSVPAYSNDFRYYSQSHNDSLNILFRPSLERSWQAHLRVTLAQPDGYEEDTLITLDLTGRAPQTSHVTFLDTTSPRVLDFGDVSVCTGDVRPIVLADNGCTEVVIDAITSSDPAFSLASTFRPFTLSAGSKRTFLVRFLPKTTSQYAATLLVRHNGGVDTLSLSGKGIAGEIALNISKPDTVFGSLCDSTTFAIDVRNASCAPLRITSVVADTPIATSSVPLSAIASNASGTVYLKVKPSVQSAVTKQLRLQATNDVASIDTTVSIVIVGTVGKRFVEIENLNGLRLTSVVLQDVSICDLTLDTFLIAARGCGSSRIDSVGVFTGLGHSIVRAPNGPLGQGTVDTVIIAYQPNDTGFLAVTLTVKSDANTTSTTYWHQVTPDTGHVYMEALAIPNTLLCDSSQFVVDVVNTMCDSVTLVSANIASADSDFVLRTIPSGIASRSSVRILGTFAPKDALLRRARMLLAIQHRDGSIVHQNMPLEATGIGGSLVEFRITSLTPGSQSALESTPVAITAGHKWTLSVPVGALDIDLETNTDLLTPYAIAPGSGSWGTLKASSVTVTNAKSAHVHLELQSDAIMSDDYAFQILCKPFVTDTFRTGALMKNPTLTSLTHPNACVAAQASFDSFYFSLNYLCSDSTLKDFIKYQRILVDRVAPNPTSGEVTVTLDVPRAYDNGSTLEVYDALGERKLAMPLMFEMAGRQNVSVHLTGESGVRYIVLRSAMGVTTVPVMFAK